MSEQICECGHPKEYHILLGDCTHITYPGDWTGIMCQCTSFREQPKEEPIDELSQLRAENEQLRAELAALKRPPAILDQDERKDLEQRLYEAQMLEGSEMEY